MPFRGFVTPLIPHKNVGGNFMDSFNTHNSTLLIPQKSAGGYFVEFEFNTLYLSCTQLPSWHVVTNKQKILFTKTSGEELDLWNHSIHIYDY